MSKKLMMNNKISSHRDETVFAEYSFNNTLGDCLPATLTIEGGYSILDEIDGNITHRKLINSNKNAPSSMSFSGRTNLVSVGYMNVSNTNSVDSMFRNCTSLISIDGSEWDFSNIVKMGSFAISCFSLTKVKMGNCDTSNLERCGNAFDGCKKLSGEIIIRNSDIIAYAGMFSGASTNPDSKFIVKYIDEKTKVMAEKLVATKSSNSNVFLWEGENV